MPNYGYYCQACKQAFERSVPAVERDNQVCDCSRELERKIIVPEFRLKGDGWVRKNDQF